MYDVSTLCKRFRTSNGTLYDCFEELGLKPAYQRGEGKGHVRLYDPAVIDNNEGRIASTLKRIRFESNSNAMKRVAEERRAGIRPTLGGSKRADLDAKIDALTAKVDRLLEIWDSKPTGENAKPANGSFFRGLGL